MVPPPHVKAELEDFLRQDNSRLGDVYRRYEQGLSTQEIRDEYSSAWSYVRMIEALLYGRLPSALTVANGTARKFRSILKERGWSDDTRRVLSHNLQILKDRVSSISNITTREQETAVVKRGTSRVEALNMSGIYVYTLPHYYWYPYDPDSGRTLYKVGRSGRKVFKRLREQTRTTALPEDPILPRLYPVEDSDRLVRIENRFHRLLEAAGHDRSTARTGGTEWFLTSLEFLDEIAGTLDLPIIEVDNPEDDLDDEGLDDEGLDDE